MLGTSHPPYVMGRASGEFAPLSLLSRDRTIQFRWRNFRVIA